MTVTVLEGTKEVPRNGGRKQQLVLSCFAINSLHAQTLVLTDAQTSFLGTSLVPLKTMIEVSNGPLSQGCAPGWPVATFQAAMRT